MPLRSLSEVAWRVDAAKLLLDVGHVAGMQQELSTERPCSQPGRASCNHDAAKIIVVNGVLAQYGPGAKDARNLLCSTYAARVDQLFPGRQEGSERLPRYFEQC
jgi:hypothetical protein